MALTDEEQQLYEMFQTVDLLDQDYAYPFIDYCQNVLGSNYESRKPILDLCKKVKNDYINLVNEGLKKPTDEINARIREGDPVYWGILKMEAQNKQFDSYCIFLEKDREPNERFYMPRRRCLRRLGIPQAFQRLIDDELDLLTISLPPGTGKAQPLDSKVLTPDGFKRMGDIKVGDEVIAGNGNRTTVIGIYPQGVKDVYEITLETGAKCRCTREHLWYVRDVDTLETYVTQTRTIEKSFELGDRYGVPVYENGGCRKKKSWITVESCWYVGQEECQCIMIADPCHLYITDDYIITHNTTLEKYFHSAVAGWYPMDFSLFYSHSGDITRMYYDGVYDIVTNTEDYCWDEIFPDLHVTQTNAKLEQFNVGKYKPFPSVQCTSVGAKNAGKVRASRFLFLDDLIGNIEEALNKTILEKRWNAYTTDARQRKTTSPFDGKFCKELVLMTRWSTLDPIARLQVAYEGNDRAEFIAIPDINPKTGKSNFEYDIGGFTAENFHDIEMLMDEVSYRCLYKQDPIERDGLLYPESSLRRYSELPNAEPDAVLGICDTKTTGIDYMFLPVFYQYGCDYYLVDCICDDNVDFNVQYARCTEILLRHKVQMCEFESNAGGSRIAFEVQDRVKKQGGTCTITTHPTETNKETRIIVNAEWIKRNVLFLDGSKYAARSDYGKMMGFLVTYSQMAKNKHDDVPDGMANFRLFVTRSTGHRQARIIESPI